MMPGFCRVATWYNNPGGNMGFRRGHSTLHGIMKRTPLFAICLALVLMKTEGAWCQEQAGTTSAETRAAASVPNSAEAGAATSESTAPAVAVPLPLPLQPYLVTVEIAVSTPGASQLDHDVLLRDVNTALERMYGQMWSRDVRISDWLLPGSESQIERIPAEELGKRYSLKDAQKVMLVAVEAADGGWKVCCREYDRRIEELTPVLAEVTYDRRSIADVAVRLMKNCFRPVLLLTGAAKGTDELEFYLQAGQLVPPDPSAQQIAEGDVLRPFLRHLDRRDPQKLKQLQKLDLTYIRVTEFNRELTRTGLSPEDAEVTVEGASPDETTVFQDRSHVKGVLISHGLAPFGGRGRNVEQLALRQRPMATSSRVRLVLNLRPDRPLVSHRVDRVSKLRYKDENSDVPVRMLSDRNGEVEMVVDPKNPTFWLYVYSGSLLLARVPYAPGLLATDTIKLPDDSIRLGVEGELYLFRDQLIDVVAQRAVFKGMAKQAAAAGDTAKLEEAVKGLIALPGRKEFELRLNAIQVPAVKRAEELRNGSAKRTVNKLCAAMAKSLGDFFSAEKQVKELEEVERLRNLAEQRTGAPAASQN